MALSRPFKEDRLAFLFPRLSPPDDRWCDVLGFVPVGSVSSLLTLQIFREGSRLGDSLCPQVYLLCRFPSTRHVQGSTPTGGLEGWMSTIDTFRSGLLIPLFPFCSKLVESVRIMVRVVRPSPLEAIHSKPQVTASSCFCSEVVMSPRS